MITPWKVHGLAMISSSTIQMKWGESEQDGGRIKEWEGGEDVDWGVEYGIGWGCGVLFI